jgi:hypothetical protein
MPAMQFPKILAFIEGTMERLFVNNNFHYVEVISLSNGSGWTIEALCKQIGSKWTVRNGHPDFVVVWLDLENQSCSANSFRAEIRSELESRGVDPSRLSIFVADKMTENIILADDEIISTEFGIDFEYEHEGQNGKHILSELFLSATNRHYKETFDGVRLLKKIPPSTISCEE